MGRAPCCDSVGLKKGPWTAEEDQKLLAYIKEHGHGSWRSLPAKAGLLRCGKSCRLRWTNYLRPDIKRGKFSLQEEQIIIQFHALLGNRWSAIAAHLPQRTDNEIKNYWNTHLKKRLAKMGIDPVTHKRQCDSLVLPGGQQASGSISSAGLSHMAQWETARLEAEARLARESTLRRHGLFPVPSAEGTLISPPLSSSFRSSAGNHLDMAKLKALLLRTRKAASPSRPAVGHARAGDRPLASSSSSSSALADSPTSTLSHCEPNIFPEPPEVAVGGSPLYALNEYSLPLPNGAQSFSEERSPLDLSEAGGAKSLDEFSSGHDAFVADWLLADDHMAFMSNAESRDYWSHIFNMANSPHPLNSSVQTFF